MIVDGINLAYFRQALLHSDVRIAHNNMLPSEYTCHLTIN